MSQKEKKKETKKEDNKDVIVDISSEAQNEKESGSDKKSETEKQKKSKKRKNKKGKGKKKNKIAEKTVPQQEFDELNQELESKNEDYEKIKDKYYRLAAEFENFKKRTSKELAGIHKYAGEKVLKEIIPVFDDIVRAIENESSDQESDNAGLSMIYKKFANVLKNLDVKPIEALGETFNPDFHHALMVREEKGIESDIVVEEFEKGYIFKDKVLKHSKVVVSK